MEEMYSAGTFRSVEAPEIIEVEGNICEGYCYFNTVFNVFHLTLDFQALWRENRCNAFQKEEYQNENVYNFRFAQIVVFTFSLYFIRLIGITWLCKTPTIFAFIFFSM